MTGEGQAARTIARGGGHAVWRQIVEHLAADIDAGRLQPGARLPNEMALAETFSVNRHTVRRALAELAAKGLVRASIGRGTFVELPRLAYPIGPRTRFTEIVESGGREASGELISSDSLVASAEVARRLNLPEGASVLRLVTRRSADGVPVAYGTSFLPLPRFAGLAERWAEYRSITKAFADFGVADYSRAETRITAREAAADEAAELDLAARCIVMVLESLNVDSAGVPIQLTRSLFAADRVELVVGR